MESHAVALAGRSPIHASMLPWHPCIHGPAGLARPLWVEGEAWAAALKPRARRLENRRFPHLENSLIPPQFSPLYSRLVFGQKCRGTRVSLRSIETYDVKVRCLFASAPALV